MAALAWGAATDAGRVRDTNEDSYVAEPMIFVVADGMGGHQAGEVASELATTTLKDRLGAGAPSADVVVAAVVEANAHIFQTAHTNAAQRGISFETGSTGLGLYFADVVAHLHIAGGKTGHIHLNNGGSLGGGCFSLVLP